VNYLLYPVRSGKEGRKQGEFHLGTCRFENGQLELDVPDKKMAARLRQHFGTSFRVRVFGGEGDNVMAHRFEELAPGTREHFQEGLRCLLRVDVLPIPEPI
jgi:hypothetical protein